jgi:hypothetical protein
MKERWKKGLAWPLLPFVLSFLLLVVLLCGLSQATEAEPAILSASQERVRPSLLDYQIGVSVCQQAANQVPTPGFERGGGNPWKPYDWYEDGPCIFSYDDPGPDSDRSARIAGTLSGENCKLRTRTDWIRVEPGRSYDYSALIKADLLEGDAYLRICFWSWQDDPPGWRSEGDAYTRQVTDTDGAWVEVSGSVTASVRAQYARIEATLTGPSAGSVWFDDIYWGLATCLEIIKSVDPPTATRGEPLTYTIVYSNTGREKATDVQVIETYKYVDFSNAEPFPDLSTNIWEIPTLSAGFTGTVTVWVRVQNDIDKNLAWIFNDFLIRSEEVELVTGTLPIPFYPNGGCKILLHLPLAEKPGEPGYQTDYGLNLENAGVCDGTVSLAAKSSRDWDVITPPTTIPLDSGESKWVTVSPVVPPDAPGGTIDTTFITATLACGSPCTETTTATATEVITTIVIPISLTNVTIGGPTTGHIDTTYAFIANVSPVTANQPITYAWRATEQSKVVTTVYAPEHAVFFAWGATGAQTIVVTATNALSTAIDTHVITIITSSLRVYLPLVLCRWPPEPPRLDSINYPVDKEKIDGSYDVCWSTVSRAESYVLEEGLDELFNPPTVVYTITGTFTDTYCYHVNGKDVAWYYYRVKACNGWGCTGWSNVEEVRAWEQEDNDSCSKANGPLISGEHYYGYPDDQYDCFKIHPDRKGQITMKLENHTGTCVNLILYYQSEANPVCRATRPPYEKTCDVISGPYCICIRTDQGHNRDTPYTLTATFP